MPRKSADRIYVHRFEAGPWERENILKPVADLTGTLEKIRTGATVVVGVAIAGGIAGAWVIAKKIADIPEDIQELLGKWWDKTILSADNRQDWREFVNGPNGPEMNTGIPTKEELRRTPLGSVAEQIWDLLFGWK